MFGNLQHLTEQELLDCVQRILSRPGPTTSFDETELSQINTEFVRRERVAVLTRLLDVGAFA